MNSISCSWEILLQSTNMFFFYHHTGYQVEWMPIGPLNFTPCEHFIEFISFWYTKTPLMKLAKIFPWLMVLMSPFSLDVLKSNSVFDCGEFISPTSRTLSLTLILKFQWRYLCMKYVFHNVTCSTLNPKSLYFLKTRSPWRLNYNRYTNVHSHDFSSAFNTGYLPQSILFSWQSVSQSWKKTKHAACQIWDQHCCYDMSYEFKSYLGR